jgi:iron(III) transport system ATP-binding protein
LRGTRASALDGRHVRAPQSAPRSLIEAKSESGKATRGKPARGKAAVTFAARLTFDNVSRHFGDTLALDRVSIDVEPGEVLCLLGPSGCGKSTLLRIAAGVERPSSGRILLDEQEVAGPNRFMPPEKRGVGLMFQDFTLFPHLSILDNVAFGLKSLTTSCRAASSSAWRSPAPSRQGRAFS